MTYLKDNDQGVPEIVSVPLGSIDSLRRFRYLQTVGEARFNTRMVRNMWFLTNVQRLIRLRLAQELTEYRSVIVPGHSLINAGVTEYGNNPVQVRPSHATGESAYEFSGMNETAESRRYGEGLWE